MEAIIPAWAEGLDCAVTVCDAEGVITIRRLLAEGSSNTYSITKQGRKKIIHQTPWRREDGTVGGLVEISLVVPEVFPHYDRDKK